ncbi:hypothetical protein MTR67_019009 [Solanum verrucosum]|uniref:Uncharacterized protein n=1 Tax=Solanum verrucosum TaxID=315347 RepID=A0AAF0QTF3_SOLVR|nr:hypothetical protein MTR67_019009 [Solanum verrucosum]
MQKVQILSELAILDTVMENVILTKSKAALKATLLMDYEEHLKNEELAWRQRSRALWLKEGDKNTKFFHKVANAHKRSNNIDQLMIEDEPVMDPVRIRGEIIEFYQKLFSENTRWRPSINLINCPMITEEEREALQGEFEEQEVFSCLKMCAMDKALGPDGFTMGIYIKCWDVAKKDIMETFKNLHFHGVFEKKFQCHIHCFDSKE